MTPIRRIVVVGGGTAGWLSAAYLQRALGESVGIRLVESTVIHRLGVGEATIPTLAATMAFLGFADEDWMPAVGATYKSAIRFRGWSSEAQNDSYWHPFISRPEPMAKPFAAPYFPSIGEGLSLLHYALKRRLTGGPPLAHQLNALPALCEAGLAPVHPSRPELSQPRAFHIDAHRLADFLRDRSIERGVDHVLGHVVEVTQGEQGQIKSVQLEDGRSLHGDLFIDCSGFGALLINQTLGVPFQSDTSLFCDRAVAIQCETADSTLPPYSTATALRNGWMWHIPLFERDGCGYVYSSNFCSSDEAEAELRSRLASQPLADQALHLKMRVGRSREFWVRNCVAIGLSGSFLEPLESTGIFLVEFGLATLLTLWPDRSCAEPLSRKYNAAMADMYDEVRDFIVLHYVLANRKDTAFWLATDTAMAVPESLREKMSFFEVNLPVFDALKLTIFQAYSYSCILDGNGVLPKSEYQLAQLTGYDVGFKLLDEIAQQTKTLLETMPSHRSVLETMYREQRG